MKRVVQEYGSMAIAMIGCIAAITFLVAGVYTGTSGTKTRGLMAALGKEATFREQDTTPVRGGLIEEESEQENILVRCQQVVFAGQEMDINELFPVEGEKEKYPLKIQHIYNSGGEDVLREKEIVLKENRLCIGTPGWYNIYVLVRADKKVQKVFKIYVM